MQEIKGCQDPAGCQEKRTKFQERNAKAIAEFGQYEFELLQNALTNDPKILNISIHSNIRSFERAISKSDILTVISEGDIIEFFQDRFNKMMLVWGYVRSGNNYRPLHVVLKKNSLETKWTIVTVYDPRSEAWRWNGNFTERICFCKFGNSQEL